MENIYTHCHQTLSKYFAEKHLYLDEDKKKPNTRKLVELPWQQTKAEMWDELESSLSNIEFLDCKCEAIGIDVILVDLIEALNSMSNNTPERAEITQIYITLGRQAYKLRTEPSILSQVVYNQLAWSKKIESKLWKSVIIFTNEPRNTLLLEVREPVGSIETEALRTIVAPSNKLYQIAVSPNGRWLAGACGKIGTCIWDAQTGILLHILKAEHDHDMNVTFNSDGTRLATGGTWSYLKVWDVATGTLTRDIDLHAFLVDLFYSTALGAFVYITDRGNVYIFPDDASGAPVLWYTELNFALRIAKIAVSRDGNYLAAGDYGGIIGLADMTDASRGWKFLSLTSNVETEEKNGEDRLGWEEGLTQLALSPNGQKLVSTHKSWKWRMWNLNSSIPIYERRGHRASIESLAFHPTGTKFATGGEDGEIHIWDVDTGKRMGTIIGHYGFLVSLQFSPDGKLLYSGCDDGTIKIWDVDSSTRQRQARGHSKIIYGARFSYKAQFLASWEQFSLRIWRVRDMQCLKILEFNGYILDATFSTDEKLCAISVKYSGVFLYDTDSWETSHVFNNNSGDVISVVFSPDNKYLAAGDYFGFVCVWNTKNGSKEKIYKPLASTGIEFMGINALAYSSDGIELFASAAASADIFICSITNGQVRILTLGSHLGSREYVQAMSGENKIVTTNASNTLEIIDTNTGAIVNTIDGKVNQNDFKNLSVSYRDIYIATVSGTERVNVWCTITGKRTGVFHCHYKALAVHFHPETNHLFVADLGGSIHIPVVYELYLAQAESDKQKN